MLHCRCETCRSDDPRDTRHRASIMVEWGPRRLIVDVTPEFRLQLLREHVFDIDGVLLTHSHSDHINGFDDLRQFTFGTDRLIPVFASSETLRDIRERFSYIWKAPQIGGGLPKVDLTPISRSFSFHGLNILPIPIKHGILDIYGYRFGSAAYISDVSGIPPASMKLLEGIETLIIDAVRYKEHKTHFNVEQALAVGRKLNCPHVVLTHLNHDLKYRVLSKELPDFAEPAWDGMRIAFLGE